MRPYPALALALCLLLAGCSFGFQTAPSPTDRGGESPTAPAADAPPDPDGDALGWEDGRWANESLTLNTANGLNASERRALVARAMARVEVVRGLEFEQRVDVEIISRESFRGQNESGNANGTRSEAFRTFDNAKFEAMFLLGEDRDSLAVQNRNSGESVAGYYDPRKESIVVVSGGGNASVDELTLGHELVHAVQDQTFGLDRRAATREEYNAHNGLIEGDAQLVQQQYRERCGAEWQCLTPQQRSDGGSQSDFHLGIFVLNYFPYAEGPGFVEHFRDRGGWERVNELYDDYPASTEQIVDPELYGREAPRNLTVADDASNGWERVRPPARESGAARADYASLGQSGLVAMFAYTLYDDYNPDAVVAPNVFLEGDGITVNEDDPFNYSLAAADGWDGDRMHVYRKGDETGYVWKLAWDSPGEAREFADAYADLLDHWGATRVAEDTYRIDDGPFADAFYLRVEGDTVFVVNAPTTDALNDVHGGVR